MKRHFFFSIIITAIFIISSYTSNAANTENEANTDSNITAATTDENNNASNTTMDNTLTEAEKKDGFKLLFYGKIPNGWRTYKNKAADSWSVKDGTFYCKGDSTNKSDMRSDMITNDQFENFDLSIDWKISPQGNTGVIYLATEEFRAAYLSGPEYQMIDDKNFPEKLEDWQKTGANYAMNPAPSAAPNPVGEWNTTRIIVNKGHVEHWLNGEKIVEYEIGSEEWKKNKMNGK